MQHSIIRIFLAAAAVSLLTWNFPVQVRASAGDLDPSFGDGGKANLPFPESFGAEAIARQKDGKLVAAGIYAQSHGTLWDFFVARFNADGSVDESFGDGGKVITDFDGDLDWASSAAILQDGRILVAGGAAGAGRWQYDFGLACYKENGSLDKSFGSGGKVLTDMVDGRDDGINSIAVQRDGRIVVAGYAGFRFGLARYNPDGTLDSTFGSGGKVKTKFPGESAEALGIAIQPDGKIVAVGRIIGEHSDLNRFALARYNPDGSLDSTFADGGKIIAQFVEGEGSGGHAVLVQPDGRIVAAGTSGGAVLARFTRDGSPDPSFGDGGKIILPNFSVQRMLLQPDGRLVTAGTTVAPAGGDSDFLLARWNPDGTSDDSFGDGGRITTDFFGSTDRFSALLMMPDGRLVAAGSCSDQGYGGIALACYLNDVDMEVRITGAEVSGKRLYVYGKNFDYGAMIWLDGEQQKTAIDEINPTTILIGKKAGKKLVPGETVMLQVKNGDDRLSNQFSFTRPVD